MIDKYLQKTHDYKNYNCWDFIREVWLEITGEDIGYRTPPNVSKQEMKERFAREEREFLKLEKAEDPCIVLFTRNKVLPHVGILYKNKVLHLPERSNGRYEPLEIASLGFKGVGFYKCKT